MNHRETFTPWSVGTMGALVLGLSSSAHAVSATTDSNEATAGPDALEEIVVTAQKREQRLQDVPIGITVMRGTTLDSSSAVSFLDALGSVPGVAITGTQNAAFQGGGAQLSIRGDPHGRRSVSRLPL